MLAGQSRRLRHWEREAEAKFAFQAVSTNLCRRWPFVRVENLFHGGRRPPRPKQRPHVLTKD